MVAVNWIIKSSERCEHHKGLVDGRLSQESDNTYREPSRAELAYGGQTLALGFLKDGLSSLRKAAAGKTMAVLRT